MFQSKKPKFKLELGINELSNIPQVSGNCYIDIQIKDNKRIKSLQFNPFKGHDTDDSSTSLSLNSATSGSSGNVSITTSNKKIHNFKCSFNYKVSCNLRFGFKRRENLINDKFLLMRIYYVSDSGNEVLHNNKLELGKLEINLAEYLNFSEPITSKYLLKDSKVNLILSLTIHLSELPTNFDFHTQLTITDITNPSSISHYDTKPDQPTAFSNANTKYNVPQFERKNIFGGLNDVIGSEQNLKDNSKINLENHSQSHHNNVSNNNNNSNNNSNNSKKASNSVKLDNNTSNSQTQPQLHVANGGYRNDPVILVDPIINDLYRKILESTWDSNLHALLDFTPEVCVDSIFDGTFDQWKERLAAEVCSKHDEDDDEIRCIHGLVNELNYRDDLKSWAINGEV